MAVPELLWGGHLSVPHGDWLFVEIGARILLHHHAGAAAGPPLHVYGDNPEIQIGPPALLLAAPFQWLPVHAGTHLALALLALTSLPTLWLLERAAAGIVGQVAAERRMLLAGIVVVPAWAHEMEYWGHIDDAVALLAMALVCFFVSRGEHDLLGGLVLGTGVAAKPWAVVLLPLLLAYARPQVPRAVLAFVIAAAAWWLPFVVADPGTIHTLGSFALPMRNVSTWHLFGLHGYARPWIRPVQLLGGLAISTALVKRFGWSVVPVVALAWRVTSDPYAWPYYAFGPLAGAALWDIVRRVRRRMAALPWATLVTFLAELVVQHELPGAAPAVRVTWFLVLTCWVLFSAGRGQNDTPPPRSMAGAGRPLAAAAATKPGPALRVGG